MAKLVYVEEDMTWFNKKIDACIKRHGLVRHDNVRSMKKLRQISAQDVMIVTDARLMRGYDYRSEDEKGIALILCRDFPSERSLR